jgi:hypothetical protein
MPNVVVPIAKMLTVLGKRGIVPQDVVPDRESEPDIAGAMADSGRIDPSGIRAGQHFSFSAKKLTS